MRTLTIIALLAAALFASACSSTALTDPTAKPSTAASGSTVHTRGRRTGYLVAAGDR